MKSFVLSFAIFLLVLLSSIATAKANPDTSFSNHQGRVVMEIK